MITSQYRIVITAIAGAGNAAGFIDAKRIEGHMADGSNPTNYTSVQNKERANVRYKLVLAELQAMGNLYVSDIDAPGADANTAPTTFEFTVEAERGDGMLLTRDENDADTELSGADAIKRCVARALTKDRLGIVRDIYDPTTSTAPQNGGTAPAAPRAGVRVEALDVAKLTNNLTTAEAAITVTKL